MKLCKGRRNNDLFCPGSSITFQLDSKELLNLNEQTKQLEDIPRREKKCALTRRNNINIFGMLQ